MTPKALVPAVAALALIAPANLTQARPADPAPPSAAGRQCFSSSRINNWTSEDKKVIRVRAEGNRVFQLTLSGVCPDLNTRNALAFSALNGDQVCDGMDVTVVALTDVGPRNCAVESVRRLSPEEVKALPSKLRP